MIHGKHVRRFRFLCDHHPGEPSKQQHLVPTQSGLKTNELESLRASETTDFFHTIRRWVVLQGSSSLIVFIAILHIFEERNILPGAESAAINSDAAKTRAVNLARQSLGVHVYDNLTFAFRQTSECTPTCISTALAVAIPAAVIRFSPLVHIIFLLHNQPTYHYCTHTSVCEAPPHRRLGQRFLLFARDREAGSMARVEPSAKSHRLTW